MTRRLRWRMAVSLVVTALASLVVLYPFVADRAGLTGPRFLTANRLGLGLDLRGGVELILRVNVADAIPHATAAERDDVVQQAKETVLRRIDALGVVEPLVAVEGPNRDRLSVQLPGFADAEHARAILGQTARLEWRLVTAGPDHREA